MCCLMNIKLTHQQYIKDSNGDIVTVVCRVQGYWDDNTKVYDEMFEWNPPYDKRLKEIPTFKRNGFDAEKMKPLLEADVILGEWDVLIRNSSDFSSHYMQASRKIQEEPEKEFKIVSSS